MIIVVDDEQIYLTLASATLRQDGFAVTAFQRAEEALEFLAEDDPELIISDIMMPDMDGFAFKEAFSQRYPERTTPFIFLSSLGDPEQLVRGLEADVDDYLVKPIDPRVLRAKVRSILKRTQRWGRAVFSGDLGLFPFIKVVQFCEQQGLTGNVTFSSGDRQEVVPFKAGAIQLDDIDNADEVLETLYDLESGQFTIRTDSIDFRGLEGFSVPEKQLPTPVRTSESMPMGKLSGIKVGTRLFQIQTEMVLHPEAQIVTIVILDGKNVIKRMVPVGAQDERTELEMLIDQLHQVVETEVQQKVEDLGERKTTDKAESSKRFFELFEAGFDAYRRGEIQQALDHWEAAKTLKPDFPSLDINLKIARAKLEGK